MVPERLYLKGFAGIRAGLKRDELTLDLAHLPGEASLVAIAGPNGTGKTTVMDNLHPYRLMPSRATSFSPSGFSYYEHLILPECVKELVWLHQGKRYRSTLVFRTNGRRKGEAYLHEQCNGQWAPVHLDDGAVSDGKAETYDACVEAILGNPETFFTSVFAAQNRRPLSSYTNAEVKALMVELLGLDRIRQLGEKVGQVVRLLRNTLDDRRWAVCDLGEIETRIADLRSSLSRCAVVTEETVKRHSAAQTELERAREQLIRLNAERERASEDEQRRARLKARLAEVVTDRSTAIQALNQDRLREEARIAKAEHELGEQKGNADKRFTALAKTRREAHAIVAQKDSILAAGKEIELIVASEKTLNAALEAARLKHQKREEKVKRLAVLQEKGDGLRKQAGRPRFAPKD